MKLTGLLAHDCPSAGTCPQIRDTDGDEVIVVGTPVAEPKILAELDIAPHEAAIATPRRLIYGDDPLLTVDELLPWIARHHTRDLFRLEVRDAYAVESDGEDYRRYIQGDGTPDADAKAPWLRQLASDTAAGRIWRKVHLVRGRPTDYERYEFEWGFAYNEPAGERVRILELTDPAKADRLTALGDVSVLDGEHVLRNIYDDADRFLGAQVVYGAEAAALRVLPDWLWDAAEPFASWWDRHPQYHRTRRTA